jgi:SAM-dependent methyltransferase
MGYSEEQLVAVPEGANMGLSCGNPVRIAGVRPGETVLDLGSGGGFDCFQVVAQVGESGRVIGVDMTPEMVSKARENLSKETKLKGNGQLEPKAIKKQVYKNLESGLHCAEALSKSILDAVSGESHPDVVKASSGFGGGIAGTTEDLCGVPVGCSYWVRCSAVSKGLKTQKIAVS